MSKLDKLQKLTTIVADTGEINEIKKYKPTDATTNPSLIFKAAGMDEYKALIDDAIEYGRQVKNPKDQLKRAMDKVFVNFGLEILKIVPGRVSTEVDARLSFDVNASVEKAHALIGLYEETGIDRERILIKLASTWEGIEAAEILEKEGIHCNMTLMFSLAQAIICADAGATLISPFVGRIFDWYKKAEGKDTYQPHEDPGVLSVTEIYNYYKKMGVKTQVMGASFRNSGEILELAGCDLLTIAPPLLKELGEAEGDVPRKLDAEKAKGMDEIHPIEIDEKIYRWKMCDNPMAIEKLMEGIRNFAKDIVKLEEHLKQLL